MQINILEYGAVGDGVTSNTRAFRSTITEAAKNGGGVGIGYLSSA